MQNRLIALAVGAALAAASVQAQAQQQSQTETEAGALDEITVTARRVEERLQDIPIAVTAISAEQIQELGIEDLTDVAARTPGFALEAFSGPLTQPVIRGMTQLRLTSPTQNVATVFNGIYLQRNYMIDSTLIDMERVEVIKGPQSALYGRNAFAGVLNLVTAEPGEELTARASVTFGNHDRRDVKASVNLPLASDGRAGLILGVADSTYDGSWENNHPLADADGAATKGNVGGFDKRAYYARLVFRPVEQLKIDLWGVRTDRQQESNATYSAGIRSALLPFGFTARLTPFNTLNSSSQNDLRAVLPGGANPAAVTCPAVPVGAPSVRSVRQTSLGTFILCEAPGSGQNRFLSGEVPVNPVLGVGEQRAPGVVVDPRAIGLDGPTTIYSGKVDYEAADAWRVSYQFGRTKAGIQAIGSSLRDPVNVQQPFDNPAVNLFGGVVFDASGTFSRLDGRSHELRINFEPSESLRSFVGFSYSKTEDVDSGANVFGRPNTLEPLVPGLVRPEEGVLVPTNGGRGAGFNTYIIRDETVRSAFFFVGYDFGAFELTAEGRYSKESQKARDFFGGVPPRTTVGTGPTAQTLFGPVPVNRFEDSYFTPRVTATWKLTEDNMLYANIARGVKSGGLNGNTPFVGQRSWQPETNWTLEVGTKNELLDRRLRLNAAIYATDWTDIQSNAVRLNADGTSPTGFAIVPTIVGNLGDVRVYGVEASLDFALTDHLTVGAAGAYTQSEYEDGARSQRFELAFLCDDIICPSSGDISGNQLERVPKFDANAYIRYGRPINDDLSFFVRGDVQYQTKQYLEEMNIGWVSDRTLVDATAGLSYRNFDVQIWAKNLFDEEYVTSSLALVGTGGARTMQYAPFLGEKRTVGITATAKF